MWGLAGCRKPARCQTGIALASDEIEAMTFPNPVCPQAAGKGRSPCPVCSTPPRPHSRLPTRSDPVSTHPAGRQAPSPHGIGARSRQPAPSTHRGGPAFISRARPASRRSKPHNAISLGPDRAERGDPGVLAERKTSECGWKTGPRPHPARHRQAIPPSGARRMPPKGAPGGTGAREARTGSRILAVGI